MHEVLVNRLGGLSLPRKSVVRLTDRPDMTLDVYRGRKTTIQQPTNCNLNAKLPLQLVMSHYTDTLQASFSWSANAHMKWGLCSTSFWLLLGFNFFCDLSLCLRFRRTCIRRFCTSFSLIILELCRLLVHVL